MGVKVKLFANFREEAGEASVEIDARTAGELLVELAQRYETLGKSILDSTEPEVVTKDGVTVMLNGRNIRFLDGAATELDEDDTLAIFPPIGGG
jgi:molybdopterin synthase sulfur carrier subunit